MVKNKEYYINRFVSLYMNLCKVPDDYLSSINVKKHNRAMKSIIKLRNELHENDELTKEVYSYLLENGDIYMKQSVASVCLKLKILEKQSLKILKYLVKHGEYFQKITAKRTIGVWKGKIDPSSPW